MTLVVRGVRAALRAPDDYGTYLSFGIAAMFGIQALWNLSVALALVPTKGLTLPFVSFGGSSLVVCAAGAGILLNVSRQADPVKDETTPPPPCAALDATPPEPSAPEPNEPAAREPGEPEPVASQEGEVEQP